MAFICPIMQTVPKLSIRSFQEVFLNLNRKLLKKHYFNNFQIREIKDQYLSELNTDHMKEME